MNEEVNEPTFKLEGEIIQTKKSLAGFRQSTKNQKSQLEVNKRDVVMEDPRPKI
ncbi:hypothetical protein J3Q64DRAFT_1728715, partial [Phycomyces blakesleeanus]